jgi:hypothetical protein
MNKNLNAYRIFDWTLKIISIVGVILAFKDNPLLGLTIILLATGLNNLLKFYYRKEPILLSGVHGFDYLMKLIFKDNFNRTYNLFWGLTFFLFGLFLLMKYFDLL